MIVLNKYSVLMLLWPVLLCGMQGGRPGQITRAVSGNTTLERGGSANASFNIGRTNSAPIARINSGNLTVALPAVPPLEDDWGIVSPKSLQVTAEVQDALSTSIEDGQQPLSSLTLLIASAPGACAARAESTLADVLLAANASGIHEEDAHDGVLVPQPHLSRLQEYLAPLHRLYDAYGGQPIQEVLGAIPTWLFYVLDESMRAS